MVKAANKPAHKTLKLEPEDTAGLVRPPGRPKGSRNKITKEIRAIAGKYSHRAIRSVWKLAQHAENLDVQLKALTLILAYAHGRPTDRQELTGKDGAPLNPVPQTPRERLNHALRVAAILKQGEVAADAIAAEASTDGRSEVSLSRSAGGEDTAASGSPVASSPSRKNGAADAREKTPHRPLSDRGAMASTEDPHFSENFKIEKPSPKTEPEVGDTAYLGGYQVEVAAPSREGLPPR